MRGSHRKGNWRKEPFSEEDAVHGGTDARREQEECVGDPILTRPNIRDKKTSNTIN